MTKYKNQLLGNMDRISAAMSQHIGFSYAQEGLEKALKAEIARHGGPIIFDQHVDKKISNPFAISIYAGEIVFKYAPTCATRI